MLTTITYTKLHLEGTLKGLRSENQTIRVDDKLALETVARLKERDDVADISIIYPAIDDNVRAPIACAISNLRNAMDHMISMSGGESGRDFTKAEKNIFLRLLDTRDVLEKAQISARPGYEERAAELDAMLAEARGDE